MEMLSEGIEELSMVKAEDKNESAEGDFYFKKVKSKYLNPDSQKKCTEKEGELERQKERAERTRRCGHTRIQH